ncbi:class I SAM-dependent methyltransferase [Rhizobium leguminosarum]|uniref:class I SAM-dependent methyltransferase n=1 Tax=Rhizobium leguminosarum TaxID=384 RepID=UPI001C97AA68|nr:class I SAM-dependent methyltransferase [Rhizobium leguminosarum]MBY5689333.1 class I SAM-dependent methyltransferase [Rhizobium leguminosarum]
MEYNRYNAVSAWELMDKAEPDVLVVGANTGKDCSYFIEFGAKSVTGLDVIEDIGKEYQHAKVRYVRESAEAMSFANESFDLVYCYATMEHVPDVASAFSEMARVVRKGGYIYSLAAPLWRSPLGHHMGEFEGSPWIHLVKSREEIIDYAIVHKLYPSDERARHKVNYMLNPEYFNMRPSSDYTRACESLEGFRFIHNEILMEDASMLSHPNGAAALKAGIPKEDLLGVTHRLIAQKRLRNDAITIIREKSSEWFAALRKKVRSFRSS